MKRLPDNKDMQNTRFDTLTESEALSSLASSKSGLNEQEAQLRIGVYGHNKLPEKKKDGFIKKMLLQFNNALIYVLLAAAVLTSVMQHWVDTGVILGVVIINAIVGYLQESKAEKALESIKNLLSLKALVMRDGKKKEINAELLVPGDIVYLKAGDKIPADMRLVSASRLEIDESSLTGESVAATKSIEKVSTTTVLAERTCMAYAGSTVRTGDAVGVVTASGEYTEVGKINTMLSETKAENTPLMKKINSLGKSLSVIILGVSVLLVLYAVFIAKASFTDSVISVIGLAVAAIPEGLPAILTITLAIGVQRMAGKNAIVRRLPSVETLGSVTVICSDKTGTLTKNEMTATNIYAAENDYTVSGLGYAPVGEIQLDGSKVDVANSEVLSKMIESAVLCNDSEIANEKGAYIAVGAPTEAALIVLAGKSRYLVGDNKKIDSLPFDSAYKYKASLNQFADKKILFVNGAPDKLISVCKFQQDKVGTSTIDTLFWQSKIELAASSGQRMIGCAYSIVDNEKVSL